MGGEESLVDFGVQGDFLEEEDEELTRVSQAFHTENSTAHPKLLTTYVPFVCAE